MFMCAIMTCNSCRQKDLFKEGNMHNNVLNHLISPIIFSYLMFLLACQTNVVDFRSRTLNFAFVKSKTFMASGRVSPSFSSEINLSIIQKWQNLSRYSCPVGYTKQPHALHACPYRNKFPTALWDTLLCRVFSTSAVGVT